MAKWEPPKKIEELYDKTAGNKWSSINRPTAGARSDEELQVGTAPFQLYSLATPNGQKVGILLEELGIEYDAWTIPLMGPQFGKGFVAASPNSKIPAAVDHKPAGGGAPLRLFESAGIMMYLAEKYGRFLPTEPRTRAECINWVFWQMAGQGPMTGNFGHFMVYAPDDKPEARNYGVARYGMEAQRHMSVLDLHLADGRKWICGDDYTIADMICLPWFQMLRTVGYKHPNGVGAADFLSCDQYKHLNRWADELMKRPQVQRGLLVCRGQGKPWLEDDRFKHLAKL
eukprot:gnl/TRDRNA2_/TRDRNA2_158547_c0_seq1.p1 gnl/TRDRNA2_/TRDRNA2_158547_c0~~gnl/TRDRNA2_/TRDRNA2_158547_c0_seq1.p1  ORF type:complete len:285 (+),score=61.73 gnl/TRDRNA2_/TRDRNA2_158547_c0_seq1:84-938(+)